MNFFKKKLFRVLGASSIILFAVMLYLMSKSVSCVYCNVVLISIDTLRADHMGVYGYNVDTTPNINKLSKNAILFTKAHTIFPETWESFYTLFSGRDDFFFQQERALKNIDDENFSVPSITTNLKSIGYTTAAFVTNPALRYPFFSKGFDEYNFFDKSGKNDYTSFLYDYDNSVNLTSKANDWLKKNSTKRFFLWLHYTNLHSPYTPLPKYICKIDQQCDLEKYKDFLDEKIPYTFLRSCKNKSDEIISKASNLYDAELLSVDERIGEFINQLDKLNLRKKTLIIIYGDHGEGLDHDVFAHGDALYESETHIPFIVIDPHNKKRIQINTLIDNTQMKDMILRLLTGWFNTITTPVKNIYSVTSNRASNTHSVISGNYKYIYSTNNICTKKPSEELYDLSVDPGEEINLSKSDTKLNSTLKTVLLEKIRSGGNQSKVIPDQNAIDKLKSLGY